MFAGVRASVGSGDFGCAPCCGISLTRARRLRPLRASSGRRRVRQLGRWRRHLSARAVTAAGTPVGAGGNGGGQDDGTGGDGGELRVGTRGEGGGQHDGTGGDGGEQPVGTREEGGRLPVRVGWDGCRRHVTSDGDGGRQPVCTGAVGGWPSSTRGQEGRPPNCQLARGGRRVELSETASRAAGYRSVRVATAAGYTSAQARGRAAQITAGAGQDGCEPTFLRGRRRRPATRPHEGGRWGFLGNANRPCTRHTASDCARLQGRRQGRLTGCGAMSPGLRGSRSLRCLVCGRSFQSLGHLRKHQMSLHRGAVGLLGQAVDERRDTAGTFAEEIRSSGDGARLGVTVGANHAAGGEDDLGDHAAALPAKDNETDLAALLDAAATEVVPQQPACQRGGKGPAGLQPSGGVDPAVTYASLSTQARAHYEKYKDTERAKPLVTARKRARPGQFNSYRLLTLQDFVNNVDGSGLSAAGKNQLFNLLDVWCRTKPGMPVDDGHNEELRDRFKTPHAFRKALADDLDEAVLSEGWLSCNLREFGVDHEGYYRPCLPVIVSAASSGTRVHLWSGGDGVAPPTNMRETPLDGDAFRECEADVVARHGSRAFVAGIHVSSDCMVLSGSGGTYLTDSSSSWGPRFFIEARATHVLGTERCSSSSCVCDDSRTCVRRWFL